MKRSLTLLAVSLLLVCSLTACGGNGKQQDNNANQNGSAVTGSDNAAGNNGNAANNGNTANNGENNTNGNRDDSLMEDVGDAITDGANDVRDGIDDVGDALTGNNAKNGIANRTSGTTGGTTYEQMLRNARVHDRDGDLTDWENGYTPGSMF